MAIKNPDGTIYKLHGPNPAMKTQNLWDNEFIIHNMKFQGEVYSTNEPVPLPIPLPQKDSFIAELSIPEPKPEIKPVLPEPKKEPELIKIHVYCLPATIRERKDVLYGEKYQTIQYGSPFLFEAIPITDEDLFMQVWTNVEAATSVGSVLYPKQSKKRWWKISERTEKNNGWLLTCIPSEHMPSFTAVE
jgi:hypothetical protein